MKTFLQNINEWHENKNQWINSTWKITAINCYSTSGEWGKIGKLRLTPRVIELLNYETHFYHVFTIYWSDASARWPLTVPRELRSLQEKILRNVSTQMMNSTRARRSLTGQRPNAKCSLFLCFLLTSLWFFLLFYRANLRPTVNIEKCIVFD